LKKYLGISECSGVGRAILEAPVLSQVLYSAHEVLKGVQRRLTLGAGTGVEAIDPALICAAPKLVIAPQHKVLPDDKRFHWSTLCRALI
jgi:hypothetical protein